MDQAELQHNAAATVRAAGIEGEQGVAVQEGFGSRAARAFDDTVGMVIPGASVFVRGAQRIVLVTDSNVYLLRGHRFDKPQARLAAYPISPEVMSFDGAKVTFPDGSIVYMTAYQARTLASAARIDHMAGTAADLLAAVGVSGERAVTAAVGFDPTTSKKTVRTRVEDVVVGDIDDAIRGTGCKESEGRIILITDESVYVLEGDKFSEPGSQISSFPLGPEALRLGDDRTVILPDGQAIKLRVTTDCRRLIDAATGKR